MDRRSSAEIHRLLQDQYSEAVMKKVRNDATQHIAGLSSRPRKGLQQQRESKVRIFDPMQAVLPKSRIASEQSMNFDYA